MNDSGSACSSETRHWGEPPKRMSKVSSSGLPNISSHRDRRTGLGRITLFIRKRVEKGRVCPRTAFFEWSIVPTWLPRPPPETRDAFPAWSALAR
jgi:hypothetical protein